MTDPAVATVATPIEPLRPNWRQILAPDTWSAIANASLVVATLVFLLAVPHFTRDGTTPEFTASLLQHAYVFVLLMAVTVLGRTLPLRMLAAFFFIGMFLATFVLTLLGGVMEDVFGSGRMFDSFAAPLAEEAVKAIPIALLFWYLVRRGWHPCMTDGLLLGFVLGAGLAIHEDALYGRVYGVGTEDSPLGLLLPTLGRESTLSRVEVYGFFHSGWGSLLGLAIGASFLLGRRFRWAYLIGIVGFVVVVLDHAIGNLIIENESVGDLGLLWTLDLEGLLPVYLLLIGIPAAVVLEILVLRRWTPVAALPSVSPGAVLPWLGRGPSGLLRVQAARRYSRARRAFQYLVWSGRAAANRKAARDQVVRAIQAGRQVGIEPVTVPGDRMKRSVALGLGLLALAVMGWSLVASLTAQAAVTQAACFICLGASEALNNILNAAGALAAGGLAAGAALGNGALSAGSAMGNAAVGAGRAATDTTMAAGSAMPEVLADTVLSTVIGPGVTTDTVSGLPNVPSNLGRGVANAPRIAADGARALADVADGAADLAEDAADAAEAAGRAAVNEFRNDPDDQPGGSSSPSSGGGSAPP